MDFDLSIQSLANIASDFSKKVNKAHSLNQEYQRRSAWLAAVRRSLEEGQYFHIEIQGRNFGSKIYVSEKNDLIPREELEKIIKVIIAFEEIELENLQEEIDECLKEARVAQQGVQNE